MGCSFLQIGTGAKDCVGTSDENLDGLEALESEGQLLQSLDAVAHSPTARVTLDRVGNVWGCPRGEPTHDSQPGATNR